MKIDFEDEFYNNKLNEEYKNILYDIFYKYSNYDFDIYLKIKELCSNIDWNNEKIIKKLRKINILIEF